MVRILCLLFIVLHLRGYQFLSIFLKFPIVLVAMLASTIPVSILGTQFAMLVLPFWTPEQFSQYRFPFLRFHFFPVFICIELMAIDAIRQPKLRLVSLHMRGGT
jgi:hypothetical protein